MVAVARGVVSAVVVGSIVNSAPTTGVERVLDVSLQGSRGFVTSQMEGLRKQKSGLRATVAVPWRYLCRYEWRLYLATRAG